MNNVGKNWLEYRRLIDFESDRGIILVACAMVDENLSRAIKNRLIENTNKSDLLFSGFSSPLHSLSAKIEFSFRLGLIDEDIRRSLQLLKKIRNDYAHGTHEANLFDQATQSRLRECYESLSDIHSALKSEMKKTITELGHTNPDEIMKTTELERTIIINFLCAVMCLTDDAASNCTRIKSLRA